MTDSSDLGPLLARLDKLERANRRLKRSGLAAIVIVVAIAAMGQTRAPGTLTTRKLVLVDASGAQRALLFIDHGVPKLQLLDMLGEEDVQISGSSALSSFNPAAVPAIELSSGSQRTVRLDGGPDPGLELVGGFDTSDSPRKRVLLETGLLSTLSFFSEASPIPTMDLGSRKLEFGMDHVDAGNHGAFGFDDSAELSLATSGVAHIDAKISNEGRSNIEVEDGDGFNAVVGAANLVTISTGRKESTSTANLTLFDNPGKVLWSAPR